MVCPDGIRLASRLWRPAGEGPWPVLLMRQPYGRAIASTVTYAHPRWYAAQGFLVVVQDVRGRGDSEGEFAGFAQEAADGAAAVRWCRQLPQSTGRVGTYGFSYQGLSQLLTGATPLPAAGGAAARIDPLPDALAPAMCGLDERLHWASEGGAHWWSLGLAWALQLAAQGCRRRQDGLGWQEIRQSLESGAYLQDGPQLLERLDPGGMGLAWLRRDPATAAGWRRHRVCAALLRRPLLLIGGWHDPHLHGVLDLHIRSRRAGGEAHLVIGAWSHLDWHGGLDALQVSFFRRHLTAPAVEATHGGVPPVPAVAQPAAGAMPVAPVMPITRSDATAVADATAGGVTATTPSPEATAMPPLPPLGQGGGLALQVVGSGQWCREANTDRSCLLGWRLRSHGLAAIRSEEGELLPLLPDPATAHDAPPTTPAIGAIGVEAGAPGSRLLTLVHDPWRPVLARGGHLGLPAGVVERGDLDRRGDVACFQTAPLQEPLLLLGRPLLRLHVSVDQPGFDLCACLSRLRPGGEALQLSTGVRRVLGAGAQQWRRRLVSLQPLAVQLAAGERLRLSVAAAAWPAIAVNPGDGSKPWGGSGPHHRVISLDLDLSTALLRVLPLLGAN